MQLYTDGSAEHFILTDPTFDSLQQCQESSWVNRGKVEELAQRKLGGPAKIYCFEEESLKACLLYTSPSPRDRTRSRMPSSA